MPGNTPIDLRRLRQPALFLGIALGGFFDGIVLHQILQWHHLLSNVQAGLDMRFQILADGVFHAFMYVIAGIALFQLWRRRGLLVKAGAGTWIWGHGILGFGIWHLMDSILSHWILGIHRVRMDTESPLMWDLIWLVAFGLVPMIAGWLILKNSHGEGPAGGHRAASALAIAVLVGGPVAALPPEDTRQVLVVFAPGVRPGEAHRALGAIDARVVWVNPSGSVWAVRLDDRDAAWRLYISGALIVSRSVLGAGCLAWSRSA